MWFDFKQTNNHIIIEFLLLNDRVGRLFIEYDRKWSRFLDNNDTSVM